MKLTWREGEKVPRRVHSSFGAAAGNRMLYLIGDEFVGYRFSLDTASWCRLPSSPTYNCPTIFFDNNLTLVGGHTSGAGIVTNHLFSLVEEESSWTPRWTEVFPPMPTKRYGSTALFAEKSATLVVAGGRKSRRSSTRKVELLNTHTRQWSTVADLPHPLCFAPAALCGDQLYILGESNVLTHSLRALIHSRRSFSHILFRRNALEWREVSSPPVTGATCVSVHDQLLAIGGKGQNDKPTTAVRLYDPTTNSWMIVSNMGKPRSKCIAAILPDNMVVVMGGCKYARVSDEDSDSIEIGTVEYML